MHVDSSEIIDRVTAPRKKQKPRIAYLPFLLGAVLLLIAGRGGYLQIIQGGEFRAQAEYNRVNNIVLPSPRGIVYDKHQVQLVENISSTDVVFDPAYLPTQENETHLLDRIMELMPELSPDTIKEALARSRKTQQETLLAKAIDHDSV